MAGLLDLPPEVRAIIFKPLVVSPTGCIQVISPQDATRLMLPRSLPAPGPLFYLAIRSVVEVNNHHDKADTKKIPEFISLSLLRVCRILHQETSDLFWKSHTIFCNTRPSGIKLFRGVSQMGIRRITAVCVLVHFYDFQVKKFQPIVEMALDGSLQKLDLIIRAIEFKNIVGYRIFNPARDMRHHGWAEFYKGFLGVLNEMSSLPIQKRLIILGETRFIKSAPPDREIIIADMAHEWKGQLCWDDT